MNSQEKITQRLDEIAFILPHYPTIKKILQVNNVLIVKTVIEKHISESLISVELRDLIARECAKILVNDLDGTKPFEG